MLHYYSPCSKSLNRSLKCDLCIYGGTSGGIAAAVTAEKAELETERARRTQEAADELVIDAKMKVGLTREQAIAVIKRQKDHDAAIEKLWADRRPRIVDILKEGLSDRETRAAIRELDGSITLGEINAAKATMAAQ